MATKGCVDLEGSGDTENEANDNTTRQKSILQKSKSTKYFLLFQEIFEKTRNFSVFRL